MSDGNPTASGLERALACPDSVALPQVSEAGAYAQRGTELGRGVRHVLGGMTREHAALTITEEPWRKTFLALDFHALVGDLSMVRGEMMYVWDVATGAVREIGSNRGRKYPPTGPTEIGGTNDIEGVRIDRIPVVCDMKSGKPVTPAYDNAQLKFLCACRQALTGAPVVEGRLRYIHEDGSVTSDDAMFDAFDLACFGDDLLTMTRAVAAARARLAAGGPARVHAGEWCEYCGAMPSCPRYVALARHMASDMDQIAAALATMPPEQQGIAWEKGKAIEALLDHVLSGLKKLAKERPIPLPDGRTVRAVPWTTSSFDKQRAIKLLRAHGVGEAEIAALQVKVPSEQIRAVGKKKRGAECEA